MTNIIVDEELLAEFMKKSQDPIVELQFKGDVSYGTAFNFLKSKKVPKREKTMKKIANGIGVDVSDLFKVSRTAS